MRLLSLIILLAVIHFRQIFAMLAALALQGSHIFDKPALYVMSGGLTGLDAMKQLGETGSALANW